MFIQLTQSGVNRERIVNTDHVVEIRGDDESGSAQVVLIHGEPFSVVETVEEIKKYIQVENPGQD